MTRVVLRPGTTSELPAVQFVNLAAFRPIDESFAEILGSEIYPLMYPDWQASQQRQLAELVDRPNARMFVAETDSVIVGFVIIELNSETRVGELSMLAVRPFL